MPAWGWAVLSLLGFLPFIFLILNLLGFCSGWWKLARAYRHRGRFDGKLRRFHSIQIGWCNYGGGVTVGTNAEGLYLAVFPLFRPGHPPLFFPWADVTAQVVRGWLRRRHLELHFTRERGVRLRLLESLGRTIAADANHAWGTPGERGV